MKKLHLAGWAVPLLALALSAGGCVSSVRSSVSGPEVGETAPSQTEAQTPGRPHATEALARASVLDGRRP